MNSLQFTLFNNQGVESGSSDIAWIPTAELSPHPDNPRLIYREDIIETIANSIQESGFQPCYALLVRPHGDGYQVISGHTRLKAAQSVGVGKLPCWIRQMTDEEAFMELVLANNQGELSPLEYGMHVLKYVELSEGGRGKKGGLSEYARAIGKSKDTVSGVKLAAEVYWKVSDQSDTLFPVDLFTKSTHLAAIHKVPQQYWQQLTELLIENEWSVKQTEAIVSAVKSIDIPTHFHFWLSPDKAINDTITEALRGEEPRTPRDIANWVKAAQAHYETLPTDLQVEVIDENDRKVTEYWDMRGLFLDELPKLCEGAKKPSAKAIDSIVLRLYGVKDAMAEQVKQWELSRADQAERDKAAEADRLKKLEMKQQFTPTAILGDIREVDIPADHFDLVLTDPPYLLSNGGITCRGNAQVNVNKNFADSEGAAIEPTEWLPICFDALKPGGVLVFTCTPHLNITPKFLESVGFEFLNHLVWLKRSAPPRLTPTEHRNVTEDIWVCRKPGAAHFFGYELLSQEYWQGKQPSNVLEFEQCSGSERLGWHDTQKPLSLWQYLVKAYSGDGASILDPFSGSGTTAVAAKLLLRKCTWVEQDPSFYQDAQDRIEAVAFPWEV